MKTSKFDSKILPENDTFGVIFKRSCDCHDFVLGSSVSGSLIIQFIELNKIFSALFASDSDISIHVTKKNKGLTTDHRLPSIH